MSCQQRLIGNTVSNLTNGSLKYCFEKNDILTDGGEDTEEMKVTVIYAQFIKRCVLAQQRS